MVTYGEIKELINGIIIPYKKLEDDYILNYNDLIYGKIFPVYRENQNPSLVINGIGVDKETDISINNIKVYWQVLDSVKINASNEIIKPLGGIIELNSTAKYSLHCHSIENDNIILKEYEGKIYPVYHMESTFASLKKDTLTISQNNGNEERKVTITITYRQGKNTKDDVITIIQNPNIISDWLVKKIVINNITLTSNNDIISKDGGIIDLKVIKNSTKYYYKEDTNGNILNDTLEKEIEEDITSLCAFDLIQTPYIKVLGSHLIIDKQNEGEEAREFTIIAKFDKFISSKKFYQESGGIISYDYGLQFLMDDRIEHTVELPTSLRCDGYLPFQFIKNKYVDGKLVGKIGMNPHSLTICDYNDKWCKLDIVKDDFDDDGKLLIHFDIYEDNLSKTNARQIRVELKYENKSLYVNIVQPYLKVIKTIPALKLSGETNYTIDTIKSLYVDFIPIIKHIYEDESVEEIIGIDKSQTIKYVPSPIYNGIVPHNLEVTDFNGKQTLLFDIDTDQLPKNDDYTFEIYGEIINVETNEFICYGNPLSITYHGQKLYKEYEFECNTTEYTWKGNWKDALFIPIKSTLYESTNVKPKEDINAKTTNIGYQVLCTNNDNFKIEEVENGINIIPNNVNTSNKLITESIRLIQDWTHKGIDITLNQESTIEKEKPINIKVIVSKDTIDSEIWSTESILYIKDNEETVYSLQLSPCWLYPEINVQEDVIYNGYVILENGKEYNFIMSGFKIKSPISLSSNNYNINEKVLFQENDNDIAFYIDL